MDERGPTAVRLRLPEGVLDMVELECDFPISREDMDFVVYNDAERGEWLWGHKRGCPFCGAWEREKWSELWIRELTPRRDGDKSSYVVNCGVCGAQGPVASSLEEAWRLWDRRKGA